MFNKTKGQIEAEISEAIIKFEKEHLGRGPKEARTFIVQDMIVVRLRRVLTPAEIQLAKDPEGCRLIKEVRHRLLEGSRSILEKMILDRTGEKVISLHTDISTKTGERIIIFSLKENLGKKIRDPS